MVSRVIVQRKLKEKVTHTHTQGKMKYFSPGARMRAPQIREREGGEERERERERETETETETEMVL